MWQWVLPLLHFRDVEYIHIDFQLPSSYNVCDSGTSNITGRNELAHSQSCPFQSVQALQPYSDQTSHCHLLELGQVRLTAVAKPTAPNRMTVSQLVSSGFLIISRFCPRPRLRIKFLFSQGMPFLHIAWYLPFLKSVYCFFIDLAISKKESH